jgi:type III restriction enzyme
MKLKFKHQAYKADAVRAVVDCFQGQPAADPETERKARAASLIAALSRGKNTEPIGPLNRDEIYDRQQGKWD